MAISMRDLIGLMEKADRPLIEAMQDIGGLALAIRELQLGVQIVLYNPAEVEYPLARYVRAVAVLRPFKDAYWIVGSIFANNGCGPLAYAIAAEIAGQNDCLLIPSDIRSPAAKATWAKFDQNPYVEIQAIADKTGSGGPYNVSPTGFGIRGNGMLDLNAPTQRDAETAKNLGTKWHAKMLDQCYAMMKRAVN